MWKRLCLIFLACSPLHAVQVTITASTAGLIFSVSGYGCSPGSYSAPQSFDWAKGATCTVAFLPLQSLTVGTQFIFVGWQDAAIPVLPASLACQFDPTGSLCSSFGGPCAALRNCATRAFPAPANPTSYVARFRTQYLLTTATNPRAGGSVSGGGWYDPGALATLTASPASGYLLAGWTAPAPVPASANPIVIAVAGPETVTANFVAASSARPPSPLSVNPPVSTGASQAFTFIFTDPDGAQNLDVLDILINATLDSKGACYMAYQPAIGVVWLVNDNGTLGGGAGLEGGAGNDHCLATNHGSLISTSGNDLILTLNINFNASVAGNKVIYMAARDTAGNNSGWQVMGTHAVPPLPATFPMASSVSPAASTTTTQTITFTYQDATSATDLQTVWALINTAIDGRAACYVAYYRPGNQLFLYPDSGDGSQATSIVLTGNNTISNSQCSISAAGAIVQTTSGGTLAVTLPITMKSFAGPKGIWLAAQTVSGQASAWQALGVWNVPGQ